MDVLVMQIAHTLDSLRAYVEYGSLPDSPWNDVAGNHDKPISSIMRSGGQRAGVFCGLLAWGHLTVVCRCQRGA